MHIRHVVNNEETVLMEYFWDVGSDENWADFVIFHPFLRISTNVNVASINRSILQKPQTHVAMQTPKHVKHGGNCRHCLRCPMGDFC